MIHRVGKAVAQHTAHTELGAHTYRDSPRHSPAQAQHHTHTAKQPHAPARAYFQNPVRRPGWVLEMSLRMPRFWPKNAFNASFSASEHGILSGKRNNPMEGSETMKKRKKG